VPVELDDPRATKRAFREAIGEAAAPEIQAAIEDAVSIANDILLNDTPPEGASMEEWSMESIADSVEVYWEQGEPEGELAQGNALVAEWTHPHANKIEVGVRPHEIEADDGVLVFEWHNAPDEVRAQFQDQWEDPDSWLEEPMVTFAKVQHPGIPPVGFIRAGFRRALKTHFS
jgi:hypothetical protein